MIADFINKHPVITACVFVFGYFMLEGICNAL